MKLMFVYGILPALVFYTDSLKELVGGSTNGPIIRIRPRYKDVDAGILQHELTHVKQWYRTFATHGLWKLLFESYKLRSEVEAYKVQAQYYETPELSYTWMAVAIASKYGLTNYTEEEILARLRS